MAWIHCRVSSLPPAKGLCPPGCTEHTTPHTIGLSPLERPQMRGYAYQATRAAHHTTHTSVCESSSATGVGGNLRGSGSGGAAAWHT